MAVSKFYQLSLFVRITPCLPLPPGQDYLLLQSCALMLQVGGVVMSYSCKPAVMVCKDPVAIRKHIGV
jgi:hypothetical protein